LTFTNEEERKASLFNTIKNDLQKNDQIEYFEKIRNDLEKIKFDISNLEIQRKELCSVNVNIFLTPLDNLKLTPLAP